MTFRNQIEIFYRASLSIIDLSFRETLLSMQLFYNIIKVPVLLQGYHHHYFSNAQCYSLNKSSRWYTLENISEPIYYVISVQIFLKIIHLYCKRTEPYIV